MTDMELILRELDRHDGEIKDLKEDVSLLKTENAVQNYKQGVWGAIGSSLPVLAYFIYEFLKKG